MSLNSLNRFNLLSSLTDGLLSWLESVYNFLTSYDYALAISFFFFSPIVFLFSWTTSFHNFLSSKVVMYSWQRFYNSSMADMKHLDPISSIDLPMFSDWSRSLAISLMNFSSIMSVVFFTNSFLNLFSCFLIASWLVYLAFFCPF